MQMRIDSGWFSGAAVAVAGALVSIGLAIRSGGARAARLLLRLDLVEKEQVKLRADHAQLDQAQRAIQIKLAKLPGEILDRLEPKFAEIRAALEK